MKACRANATFYNWDSTLSSRPARFCQPDTVEDLCEIVKTAAAEGSTVRVTGAGHSWSDFVLTNQTLVNLDKLTRLRRVDGTRVTIEAGIRLKNLTALLADNGLGMKNLGTIREQSIAGAISTGTHGTGQAFGNISTQIVGMKLVKADGSIWTITEQDSAMLRAARVSIGALGIITEVTLDCVDHYELDFSLYRCHAVRCFR
jgi:FAD/FMN-containing dehydrogenase